MMASKQKNVEQTIAGKQTGGGHASVLVIDSDADSRDWLTETLESEGHTVAAAENGDQALPLLRTYASHFGAILLDVTDKKTKYEKALEAIKASSRLREIPVIALSSPKEIKSLVKSFGLGAEDYLLKPIDPDMLAARLKVSVDKTRLFTRQATYIKELEEDKSRADHLLNSVIPVGVALLSEQNLDRMLEMIMLESISLTGADGGTLYLRNEEDCLEFVMMHNGTLDIALGGTTGKEITFPPLCMYDEETSEPNHKNVATHVALTGESINIRDAYVVEGFDFSGTKRFDKESGYRSQSFLTTPLKNNVNHVIGVLQLINALDQETGKTTHFVYGLQVVVEALAGLAAVALEAYVREEALREQITKLRIEIDEALKTTQVRQITESEYFKELRAKAKGLKNPPKESKK